MDKDEDIRYYEYVMILLNVKLAELYRIVDSLQSSREGKTSYYYDDMGNEYWYDDQGQVHYTRDEG